MLLTLAYAIYIYITQSQVLFPVVAAFLSDKTELNIKSTNLSGRRGRGPTLPAKPEERGRPPVPPMAAAAKPALHEPERI